MEEQQLSAGEANMTKSSISSTVSPAGKKKKSLTEWDKEYDANAYTCLQPGHQREKRFSLRVPE